MPIYDPNTTVGTTRQPSLAISFPDRLDPVALSRAELFPAAEPRRHLDQRDNFVGKRDPLDRDIVVAKWISQFRPTDP